MSRTGRNTGGRFAAGNPGRPAGRPNRSTVDARELRQRVIGSWERVDGDAVLDRLARENPAAYLRIVTSVLPRQDPPEAAGCGAAALAEWRERAGAVIGEFVAARELRAIRGTMAVLAMLSPAERDELLQGFFDEADRLPEDQFNALADDVVDFARDLVV